MKKILIAFGILILISCNNNRVITPWYNSIILYDNRLEKYEISGLYEPIINNLISEKENIERIEYTTDYDSIYLGWHSKIDVIFIRKWNQEDVFNIKNIILKTLPFEPLKNYSTTLYWAASTYDVELYCTGNKTTHLCIYIK